MISVITPSGERNFEILKVEYIEFEILFFLIIVSKSLEDKMKSF